MPLAANCRGWSSVMIRVVIDSDEGTELKTDSDSQAVDAGMKLELGAKGAKVADGAKPICIAADLLL